jgi:uncharacterized protein
MKVVIDTNILWVSISRRSTSHWLFRAILENKFTLCVTTEILNEYEEIISQKLGPEAANAVMEAFDNLPNIQNVTRYFRWNLIKIDPDDNPFVDCAIAIDANALVTHDKHFSILNSINFPKVNLMNLESFKSVLNS